MNLDEIKALIDAMRSSDLAEMEVEKDGWTLRLVRRPKMAGKPEGRHRRTGWDEAGPPPSAAGTPPLRPAQADLDIVRAPLAGIVYLSASPDSAPFVTAGQPVTAGATVCTIEAMKMFNEVRAERDGQVVAVLVGSGDEVEAGQPLLRIA